VNAFWRLSHLHGTHGSRFSPSAITLMRARFTARRSFRYDLHDRRGGRFEPHESRMRTIHPAKINLRVCFEDPQPGLAPYSAQVNSEAAVIREGVADPLGAGTVFHNDDDAPAVVEIPYGDTAPFTRPVADCFNDKRVCSRIWRPRDTNQQGEFSELIRDANDPFWKAHLNASSSLTLWLTGAQKEAKPTEARPVEPRVRPGRVRCRA